MKAFPPSQERFFLFLLFLAGLSFALCRPVDDLDLFTQIRLGKISHDMGGLVTSEPFSYLNLGQPIQNPGWLAQLIFYFCYWAGSWDLLRLVSAAIFAGALACAAALGHKRLSENNRGNIFPAAAAFVLALLVTGSNNGIRPQIFSLAGLALLMWLRKRREGLVVLLPLFMLIALVWQNCHPSLAIAIVWLLADSIGRFVCAPKNALPREIRATAGFLTVAAAAVFLTPQGFGVIQSSRYNVHISREVLRVSEWLPPWDPSVSEAMLGFWIAAAASLLLALFAGKAELRRNGVTLLAFLLLSIYSARFSYYFALVGASIWPAWIEAARARKNFYKWSFNHTAAVSPAHAALGVFAAAAALTPLFALGPIHKSVPLTAARALKKEVPEGRIYNYREWGGILIFTGFPEWRVALDGRLYLYPETVWKRYNSEAAGKVAFNQMMNLHDAEGFFLHKGFHAGLIDTLRTRKDLRMIYEDEQAIVFTAVQSK